MRSQPETAERQAQATAIVTEPQATTSAAPDTQFSLPAVGDPPSTEVGVILMGLAAEQLMAGLGLAGLAEDPTAVTLLVDQARHTGESRITMDYLVALGVQRWCAERESLPGASGHPASLRHAWARAYRVVEARQAGAQASAVYLTACWLRRTEMDGYSRLQTADGDPGCRF